MIALAMSTTDPAALEARKARARTWFEALRDDICTALEALEDALPADAPLADAPAGRFTRTPWSRTDHSGKPGGGGIGGLPGQVELHYPHGVNFDPSGALYIADSYNHRILRIDRP